MSHRHYLKIEDSSCQRVIWRCQVLGNNDYFDEEFYRNLNIIVYSDGDIAPTKVDYVDFLYEWDRWLDRHPEKKGFPQIPKHMKECEDINLVKENTFLHYASSESYEQQLFDTSRKLFRILYNWKGEIREKFDVVLECL